MHRLCITHINNINEEQHYLHTPPEDFRTRRRLGKAAHLSQFGVNISILKPGQISSKKHYHTQAEEFVLILKGRALLRYGNDEHEVEQGHCIAFSPGGESHQLFNHSDQVCEYLEIGSRIPEDKVVITEE